MKPDAEGRDEGPSAHEPPTTLGVREGVREAGVREAGVREAGVREAGVREAGDAPTSLDEAGDEPAPEATREDEPTEEPTREPRDPWDEALDPARARKAVALFVALALVGMLLAWPFTVDDAYLVARYARRLAGGLGWTFREGPATDGVTGPLWVLPGALAELVGMPAPSAQKLVGALLGLAAGVLAVSRSSRPYVTALVLATQSSFVAWSVAGLETGAATLAVTGAALSRSEVGRGLGIAAMAWLRPELAAFALVLLVARPSRVAWGLALFGAASVVTFRLALFGGVVPLAFFAKSGSIGDGVPYVLAGALFVTGGGGVLLARRGGAGSLVVALAAHVVAVAIAGGDWMPGWRLLVPVLPLYAWLVGRGFGAIENAWTRRAALGLALLVPSTTFALQIGPWRAAGEAREASGALARRIGSARSVALVDVGALVWASDVDVIDLGGLTDPIVAHAEGGHLDKRIDVAYLAARDPEVIVLHSEQLPEIDDDGRLVRLAGFPVERELAAHPWTREHYAATEVITYRDGYWYVWLARR